MIVDIRCLSANAIPTIFHDFQMIDAIRDFNLTIEPGNVYGIVGSIGSGGWLLSWLLAGREPMLTELLDMSKGAIDVDGRAADNAMLQRISCYIGEGVAEFPYRTFRAYPSALIRRLRRVKTVADQIEAGLSRSGSTLTLRDVAELFELSGAEMRDPANGRLHRPLEFNSVERWRASLAIGYAFRKKLYCAPWIEPHGIDYLLSHYNRKFVKLLRDGGASVIIPVSSEAHVAGIADRIVHVKPWKPRDEEEGVAAPLTMHADD
ncbi:hypothetical protein [Paenibacillus methanolicus]|uniref:ABC-type lipoprotein export system ATPase subunit n=1 Tax=Paenibacillus methanolicus TaxID=582686 RepID=A0A5S5C8T7_9BACL|nr:hypothetical protein [Paenibacillus methanolicus]TYP74796.1 ABC-type lipoprotein export system ATPase subunit [Paenibacillus methanolicus]